MSNYQPLIVRSDYTVLLDSTGNGAEQARKELSRFADLVKRPGDMHTYRMTPLSLWNAASEGMTSQQMLHILHTYGRYGVPDNISEWIIGLVSRYGELWLEGEENGTLLLSGSARALDELEGSGLLARHGIAREPGGYHIPATMRGELKQELTRTGAPLIDRAGYHQGEALEVELYGSTLRDYQQRAVDLFYREGTALGGSGVVVLPCGAGKTVVGIAALARLGRAALILTSSATSVQQWKQELLGKTTLQEEQIGEYSGKVKQVRPVTIATYQSLTSRKRGDVDYNHLQLFGERDFGLIIYDEVHLLPAPVFRMTADLQATRRLGLTATLVREDGRAEDVFSLIGPKLYEVPWKSMEEDGWIATANCQEIRVPLSPEDQARYHSATAREQHRIAGENKAKTNIVRQLLKAHPGKAAIVIGQYLDQLHHLGRELGAPVLTGETPQQERNRIFEQFKQGLLPVVVVSKVANFAVNLPDAAVAIQVSGSFGSRQEEAQRIGRILRRKDDDNQAYFYTLVTSDTRETEFAAKRQMFMAEQGYVYSLSHLAPEVATS